MFLFLINCGPLAKYDTILLVYWTISIMAVPTLRHALDKVRYFRNVLLDDGRPKVRIIVGGGATGKTMSLHLAIDDLKHVPVNRLCILNESDPIPQLPVTGPVRSASSRSSEATLIYIRLSHDTMVDALLAEYDEEERELVYFERDPGGLYG